MLLLLESLLELDCKGVSAHPFGSKRAPHQLPEARVGEEDQVVVKLERGSGPIPHLEEKGEGGALDGRREPLSRMEAKDG